MKQYSAASQVTATWPIQTESCSRSRSGPPAYEVVAIIVCTHAAAAVPSRGQWHHEVPSAMALRLWSGSTGQPSGAAPGRHAHGRGGCGARRGPFQTGNCGGTASARLLSPWGGEACRHPRPRGTLAMGGDGDDGSDDGATGSAARCGRVVAAVARGEKGRGGGAREGRLWRGRLSRPTSTAGCRHTKKGCTTSRIGCRWGGRGWGSART